MYAEERWDPFQSLLVPDHLALLRRAVVCPAHCPTPRPASLADQVPGLYGWHLQSLCAWSGLWSILDHGILLGLAGLHWDGVPHRYSELDRALRLRIDTLSQLSHGDESSAEYIDVQQFFPSRTPFAADRLHRPVA